MIQKFKKKKIFLHFVDLNCETTGSDAIGNVFLTMLSCFAQFQAEQTSQKIKSYKERMKTENKFSGGKMTFGYDKDENGFFVPVEKEQEIIREMLLLRKQGKSYRTISKQISQSTRKKFPLSWTHKNNSKEKMFGTRSSVMEYLCSECSTQLNKFEIELNTLYPIGRLYCEFCQNKHERQLIEKLKKSFENDLDIYDYPKYIAKLKKQE